MQIDWFTFAAQVINFLALVGLLRWFLYQPIVRAMQQREQSIANELQSAKQARYDAEQHAQELSQQQQQLEHQREQSFAEIQRETATQRRHWLAEARQEVELRREQWTESFRREQQQLAEETRRQTARMGFTAARQTLRQLAATDLQSQMCGVLIDQLVKLDRSRLRSGVRTAVIEALQKTDATVVVRSAMPLNKPDRQRVAQAIQDTFNPVEEVQFEVDDGLISGLELDLGGYRFHWSAAHLLHDMEDSLTRKPAAQE